MNGVTVTGHCKGRLLEYGVYEGCDFTWPRTEDDKVFQKEGEHADD